MGTEPSNSKQPSGEDPGGNRRSFLTLLIGIGSAFIGAILAKPGVGYVLDPLLRAAGKKGAWIRVAKADAIGEDHPVAVPVVGEHVDAWTRADNVRLGMARLMAGNLPNLITTARSLNSLRRM